MKKYIFEVLEEVSKAPNAYQVGKILKENESWACLLYTSPSPRDAHESRMPSSA